MDRNMLSEMVGILNYKYPFSEFYLFALTELLYTQQKLVFTSF